MFRLPFSLQTSKLSSVLVNTNYHNKTSAVTLNQELADPSLFSWQQSTINNPQYTVALEQYTPRPRSSHVWYLLGPSPIPVSQPEIPVKKTSGSEGVTQLKIMAWRFLSTLSVVLHRNHPTFFVRYVSKMYSLFDSQLFLVQLPFWETELLRCCVRWRRCRLFAVAT